MDGNGTARKAWRTPFARHRQIERFALMLGASLLALIASMGMCAAASWQSSRHVLSSQALYTAKFTSSRTQATGTVAAMTTSPDHTLAALLLRYEDPDAMSVDPDSYSLYLTDADLAGNPHGTPTATQAHVAVYGSSGYLAIIIANPEGFDSQALDLTVRQDTELAAAADDAGKGYDDASYAQHDQYLIRFNPGASQASTLDAINTDDPSGIYDRLVYQDAVSQARDALTEQSEKIAVDLNQVNETELKATNDGLAVPARPDPISGDQAATLSDGSVDYRPASIVDGGLMLDWQTQDPSTLLDQARDAYDPDSTYDQYFAMLARQRAASSQNATMRHTGTTWTLTDGTWLDDLKDSASGNYERLTKEANAVANAWNAYWTDKKTYQTTLMDQYLATAADRHAVLNATRTGSIPLTVYR